MLPNEAKSAILWLAAKPKKDYRVLTLVIPRPTPERPFDGLRTVPRRRRGNCSTSRFLGKWGVAFWFPHAEICAGDAATGVPTPTATQLL